MSKRNEMRIYVMNWLHADGFVMKVLCDGEVIVHEEYRYGENASYSRKWAQVAEQDHENSIKYKWSFVRPLKPYAADIIWKAIKYYDIALTDVSVEAGENIFKQGDVADVDVQRFYNDYIKAEVPKWVM